MGLGYCYWYHWFYKVERMLGNKIEFLEDLIMYNRNLVTASLKNIDGYCDRIMWAEKQLEKLSKEDVMIDSIINLCLTGK